MVSSVIFILLYFYIKDCLCEQFNLLVINQKNNEIASEVLNVATSYLKRNSIHGVEVGEIFYIENQEEDGQQFLDAICAVYQNASDRGKVPDLVLDLTLAGTISEAAKTFTSALALPTVALTYGQEHDIRTWRGLDSEQQKFLIQVSPPGDMIPEIVRSLVVYQNISNAGVLFDSSYEMDHKYKALLRNLATRHIIIRVEEPKAIKEQLIRLRNLDIVNFFILGNLTTIKNVLDMANVNKYFNKKFAWHAITEDLGALRCSCTNATVLFVRPDLSGSALEQINMLRTSYSLTVKPEIVAGFYFDVIVRSILALKSMSTNNELSKTTNFTSCDDYNEEDPPKRFNFDLRKHFMQVKGPVSIGPLHLESNGNNYMNFSMKIEKVNILNSQVSSSRLVATWTTGFNQPLQVNDSSAIANFSAVQVYRVVTVLQKPFVMREVDSEGNEKFVGYCIDLLEEICKLMDFEYEIYLAPDNSFGYMDEKGEWNGMIRELLDKKAEIALSSLYVTAERENVIDYTVPYYDLVGITILMKKPQTPTSLFKFLTVLESEVWLCILGAYFFTSFLMWAFDRYSPYSYQNNKEKYKEDDEQREFNLRECLWFCMTSLTPQGGGEAPKNMSGRLVAATWWLFGFIIIASYTANLAAFLTVSRLDTPVESLEDLSKQYKIQYAPLEGSWVQTYFQRMADIEQRFYNIWKKMSLNTSMSPVERAQLAVWDYPISDKYTKMWRSMTEAKFPKTLEEAVNRVLQSKDSSEGFAFLGDAIDIKYQALINCELQMVGDEFSRKPFAIAVQQGSPLKDSFNNAILQLLNQRKLEKLKEIWWNGNPERKVCEKPDDQADGISIHNIGGVFIVIFVGIALACVTLAFEYWWMKYKKPNGDSAEPENNKLFEQRKMLSNQLREEYFTSTKKITTPKDNIPYRRREYNRW
ncbi:ionotropic receptor 25a-like [Macrosteles quadrilineatus]|uniref:ionotropic receptor 25a-like n=1 Tax=Macrosteles quadrilineatus TaxID=74068 RepID=UPI0023E33C1F|nr:ionotropic receptor 25a-like [Macrosteles quadrilineatus]